ALTAPLAAVMGLSAAGAIGYYVITVILACAVFTAFSYFLAVAIGGIKLASFARASAPAQAVAFTARSSLASLPAMMEGAAVRLRMPQQITGFFLPLAASTFRVSGTVGTPIGVLFL